MGTDNEENLTGWDALDTHMRGIAGGKELVVICAKSNVGKSMYDDNMFLLHHPYDKPDGEITLRVVKARDGSGKTCFYDLDDTQLDD